MAAVVPYLIYRDAAGATVVCAPEHTEWGTGRARLLDPEGYQWSVGSYRPGAPAG